MGKVVIGREDGVGEEKEGRDDGIKGGRKLTSGKTIYSPCSPGIELGLSGLVSLLTGPSSHRSFADRTLKTC